MEHTPYTSFLLWTGKAWTHCVAKVGLKLMTAFLTHSSKHHSVHSDPLDSIKCNVLWERKKDNVPSLRGNRFFAMRAVSGACHIVMKV